MIPGLKVRHRLLMMPLLATLALFAVFIVAELSGARNQKLLRSLSSQLIPALELNQALEATLETIQRALQDAVAEEDVAILHATEASRDRFLVLTGGQRGVGASGRQDLGTLESQFVAYYELASEMTLRLIYGDRADVELVTTLETMTQSYTRLSALLQARTRESRLAVSETFAATVRNDKRARLINGVNIFGATIVLCVVSFYLARSLTRPLSDLVNVLRQSEGDTAARAKVSGDDEVGELALAFNEMMDKIDRGRTEIEAHSWLMTGLTSLVDSLATHSDLRALGDSIVASLARHTGALVGALYLADEGASFSLAGAYGCVDDRGPRGEFRLGDGLLGQAMKDRRTVCVAVPDDYMQVSSALGEAAPRSLLLAPIESAGLVAGGIELGSYDEFTDQDIEFVELCGERIAIAVDSLRNKIRLQGALDETRQQGQELERSRAELRTANRTLEEKTVRLETSNRDLEAFAYVASHDLQEPLRKIEVYGQRFEQKCGDGLNEQGHEYLKRMRAASERMRTLIGDLLGLSRVTTRAEPFGPTDLGKIVEQVLGDLEVAIEQTGARVEVAQMPTIYGDAGQLRQVFQNLVSNGLKFVREGVVPRIRLSARSATLNREEKAGVLPVKGFELEVEDNGIGIEERHFEKIFEVFQRLHGRNEYEGTGIGLALCRKIVDRHGGEIRVRSVAGRGSTFSIVLPEHAVNEEKRHESAA